MVALFQDSPHPTGHGQRTNTQTPGGERLPDAAVHEGRTTLDSERGGAHSVPVQEVASEEVPTDGGHREE